MKAKVGWKGRHVQIPDGWEVVTGQPAKAGDRFLRCPTYDAWLVVFEEDVGETEFDCLIREVKS